MQTEQKQSILDNVASIKKELLMMRVKASSGEQGVLKDQKKKKKEVARLLTKLNKA